MSDALAIRAPAGTHAPAAGQPGYAIPQFSIKRLAAFIFMVFGMFMAILDIQIVSASLSQIQAGLSASSDEITWVQTSVSHRRSGDDPALGFPLARVFRHAHFHHLRRRLHAHELHVRPRKLDRRDDHLAGNAGLHRRRHDSDRLRLGLHHFPALEAALSRRSSVSSRRSPRRSGRRSAATSPTGSPGTGCSWSTSFQASSSRRRRGCSSTSMSPTIRCSPNFDWIGLITMAGFLGAIEYALEEGPSKDWFESNPSPSPS